jgi:hypothetical protein
MNLRHTAALALVGRYLMVFGGGCLVVVVLTHVCEAFHLAPIMGWGLRDSPGHYLDLFAAILGVALLPSGYFLVFISRRQIKTLCISN